MYNILSSRDGHEKIPFDKWQKIELLSALSFIGLIFLLAYSTVPFFLAQENKDYIDFVVVIVSFIQFARFFCFFLVINSVSKMLLTLIAMILAIVPFCIFLSMYFFIYASIFTTLLQDKD